MNNLYIQFHVHFDPQTNQDMLHEMAEAAQERIFEMFDGIDGDTSGPLPSPHDVTYQVVMVVNDHKPMEKEG